MAKRESQGLQIALILVVMLAVLMAITTIVFWNQAKNRAAELANVKSDNQQAQSRLSTTVGENQDLKDMLGYPPDEQLDKVRAAFEQDKQKFGANFPEENRNYRQLPEFMATTINDLHLQLKASEDRLRDLEQKNKDLVAEKNKAVEIEQQAREKANQDLLQVRAQFEQDLQKMNAKRAEWKREDQRERQKLASKNSSLESDIAAKTVTIAEKTLRNDKLSREKQALLIETFENPDGRVISVNQGLQSVILNLGSADSLRRQITFSVFDVDANNLARFESKGKLEVTRILDAHLAEARILEDSPSNPITSNDVVYSPIWEVGNPVRFALTGFMDIDNDGESDRALIRRLISLNGGLIDAEVDDKGKRSGDITINTRYLVIGDEPDSKASDSIVSANTQIRNEAKDSGVTQISLDRLLSDIGYQQVSKSIALGSDARSVDFPAKRETRRQFVPRHRPVSAIKSPTRAP